MTKEQMIFSVIIPIVISIGSVAIGTYLTIYIKDKNPDIKKLNSYIKKYLFFTLKYVVPISEIILLSIISDFNKIYFLTISFLFSYLVFAALYDIITGLINELDNRHKKTVDVIKGLYECNLCICNNLKNHDKEFKCTVKE